MGAAASGLLVFVILGTVALYAYPFHLYLHFPNNPVALRAYGWGYAWLRALK